MSIDFTLPDFLVKYKQAWESHDIDLIKDIFAKDASYEEKPGKTILFGINEIVTYWQNLSVFQTDVHFQVDRFLQAENSLVAEWKAEFGDLRLKREVLLRGIMWVDFYKEKACKFVEYYRKEEGGLVKPYFKLKQSGIELSG